MCRNRRNRCASRAISPKNNNDDDDDDGDDSAGRCAQDLMTSLQCASSGVRPATLQDAPVSSTEVCVA